MTDYTYDALPFTEPLYCGASYTYQAPPLHIEADASLIQTWMSQQLWHSQRSWVRVNAASAGCFLDSVGAPTQHSVKPYKIEGVVVDQNEDIIAGATVYLLRGDFRGYSLVQMTTSDAGGNYHFYVEDPDDQYVVMSWKWDAGLSEYLRGVTDRDLTAVAT